VSLPIPGSAGLGIPYTDIRFDGQNTYAELPPSLGITAPSERNDHQDKEQTLRVTDALAHFDPDLASGSREMQDGWRHISEQADRCQTYLDKHGVGADDPMLFLGWFRSVDDATRLPIQENGAACPRDSDQDD